MMFIMIDVKLNLCIDDGIVHCPNKGDIDLDLCASCPALVGRLLREGADEIVCRTPRRAIAPDPDAFARF